MDVVSKYSYYHGAGSAPNRAVEFRMEKSGDIMAVVKAIGPKGEQEISRIPGTQIIVDRIPSSETNKIALLNLKKQPVEGLSLRDFSKCKLSDLPQAKQEEILKNFKPVGPWRILVTGTIGTDPRYEKIVQLRIFNPC